MNNISISQCSSIPSFNYLGDGSYNCLPLPQFTSTAAYTQLAPPLIGSNIFDNATKYSDNFLNIANNSKNNTFFRKMLNSPKIVEDTSFRWVRPGDFIYFAHINKLTHLFINKAQMFFGFGNHSVHNVTHVGVVTEVRNETVKVSEIPGYGGSLAENEYHLRDLFNDEEYLFTRSFSKTHELDAPYVAKVGKLWAQKAGNLNQYNLAGLSLLPFQGEGFNVEDRITIINDLIDYRFLKRDPHEFEGAKIQPKKFFCSEYSLQIQQVAHLDRVLGELGDTLNQHILELDLNNPDGRSKATSLLLEHMNRANIWKKLQQNPIYSYSSKKTSPSALATAAMKSSKLIRVHNPTAKERYGQKKISNEELPSYLEYATTKILKKGMDGEPLHSKDKDVEKLLNTMETECDISNDTLSCFWDKCLQSDKIPDCIEQCLKGTLNWKEKIYVFAFSREINRAVNYLVHQPEFVEFLQNPTKNNFEKLDFTSIPLTKDSLIEKSFPGVSKSWLSRLENYVIKRAIKNIDIKTFIKYLPLAISYSPPSETLKSFLKETNIDMVSLALQVQKLYKWSYQGYETYSDKTKALPFIWTSLKRLGFIKKENSAMSTLIDKVAQQTSYSKETLNCVVDKITDTGISPSDVESCLKNTLTIKESLQVLTTSKVINQGVENLIQNEDFLTFVRKGTYPHQLKELQKGGNKEEVLMNIFYPTNTNDMYRNGVNYASKSYISSSIKKGALPFILKDVFLGMGYDAPSEPIQRFLEKEHLTKEDLTLKIAHMFLPEGIV